MGERSHNEWKLWYKQPAAEWEEALPIGNGRLGGMVFGGTEVERIALNDDTLWAGFPRDTINYEARRYLDRARALIFDGQNVEAQKLIEAKMLGRDCEPYLPLGNLLLSRVGGTVPYSDYRRELSLADGLVTVSYRSGQTRISGEYFASVPDQVICVRYIAQEGLLNMDFTFDSPLRCATRAEGNALVMTGRAPSHVSENYRGDHPASVMYEEGLGMPYEAHARIESDGLVHSGEKQLEVRNANVITIYLAAATGFVDYNSNPIGDGISDRCCKTLDSAAGLGYEKVKKRHIEEHRSLFDRVDLRLGANDQTDRINIPTDLRLSAYKETKEDPGLESLYFHYGRYLLMASSRPGTEPANLQGIWNPHVQPPWHSDYTVNINTEMNYWLAEVCNLSECQLPLFDMLDDLSKSGRRTAEIHYGCRGWATNHNVDIWRMTTPTGGSACWAFWPLGGAWMVRHLWDRYLFDLDTDFLRERAYPLMKGAALFCLDWLIEGPDGKWVTNPSTSPENAFLTSDGQTCNVTQASTMDIMIIRELFKNCLEAARILGMNDDFQLEIGNAMEKLPSYKIGRHGQIQEWYEDYEEAELGHRHISHLYGLHPSDQIHEGTPELFEAARVTLERRLAHGGGHTGWSCAWLINQFARLKDTKQAYASVQTLLTHSTYPNLFDAHPPFQIDGNFGGTAGIAEMLLQSHLGVIELLPALPEAWPEGRVSGLKARGGFIIGMEWKDDRLVEAFVLSVKGGKCNIRYAKARTDIIITTEEGAAVPAVDGAFESEAGVKYRIRIQ
ncbi:glycosyl hydrolase family 95 catalytic domain-containing protein [Cohnella luojiensis]|uniref:Glycoside hydrolase family 95 protein n=1 Tax=Cohnella luojiensis TaxID=652876 RepID=A0A4Y8M4N7_9BACL|nr:glycoside hydrolase family 95 protein [Cohnella luojiensis]TFE30085.1 glycoside hydrolase family 95 protein [Cohnella luojiensis]